VNGASEPGALNFTLFPVGLGFAMQNIAQNFVSGLILLVERAIKPGDIVEVEGRVVRVLKMGIRTTIARTRDDEEIIIPNASLVQSSVKNYTLEDSYFRISRTPTSGSGSELGSPMIQACASCVPPSNERRMPSPGAFRTANRSS